MKVKVKYTLQDPEGELRLSSILSLTSALMGWVYNATPWPRYHRERVPLPILQLAGKAPGPVWMGTESLVQPGFVTPTIKSVSNRYNDSTITVHGRCPDIVKTLKHEVQLKCIQNEATALKKTFHYFVIKSKRLRLNREVTAVCYKKPKKHTNTIREYNVGVLNDTAMFHVITTVV